MSLLNIDNDAFKWFVFASGALVIKCVFSNTWTGLTKGRTGTIGAEEDRMFGAKKDAKAWEAIENPLVLRAQRIVFNDQENIPLWFVSAALFVATGATGTQARNWFIPYVLARYVHTLFYWNAKQPHRALAHVSSLILTLSPLFISLYRAYQYNKLN